MDLSIGMPYSRCVTIVGMTKNTTVAERFTKAREALELNQADLARKLKITPTSVNDIESGKTKMPSGDTLLKMSDLGLNWKYIVDNRGPVLSVDLEGISTDEAEAVTLYRAMPEKTREDWLAIGKTLLERSGFSPPELKRLPNPLRGPKNGRANSQDDSQ